MPDGVIPQQRLVTSHPPPQESCRLLATVECMPVQTRVTAHVVEVLPARQTSMAASSRGCLGEELKAM